RDGSGAVCRCRRERPAARMRHMRLLILGGTAFLGRALARAALDSGHDVTCAARGVTGRPPEGVHLVRVDRSAPDAYAPIAGDFDAVVDEANRPWHVRRDRAT